MHRDEHRSIRQALAEHTRTAHETLHQHRWISCLTNSSLTEDRYYCILNAYLQFYRHVEFERCQLETLEEFNLQDAINFLESDTSEAKRSNHDCLSTARLSLVNANATLGALYVLHGARFGAAILNKQVSETLPNVPRQFLENSTSRQQWRDLTDTIESLATDEVAQKDLFSSADLTFLAFGKSVTEYCESASVPL